mmetsp:Transcript_164952/g.316723  ORF Transcript_164952/g.316723 Transcript_164952/m.316723 type:complete len:141 (-) Transcript_164952:73-495(-)
MPWLPDWLWKQQKGKGGGNWSSGKGKGWGKSSWTSSWSKPSWSKGKGKGRKGLSKNLPKDHACRVWIGGIPEGTSWKAIQDHMNQAGKTTWIEVFSNKGKGTASAGYKTEQEANDAIALLNGSVLGTGTIQCDVWQKRAD